MGTTARLVHIPRVRFSTMGARALCLQRKGYAPFAGLLPLLAAFSHRFDGEVVQLSQCVPSIFTLVAEACLMVERSRLHRRPR